MKLLTRLYRKTTWMNLSTATLVALLQRSPVARVIEAADEFVAASPVSALLKSAAAAVAALGGLDSLAGATVLSTSTASPVTVTAGTAITPVLFTVTNTINIGSWVITGQVAPGLTLSAVEGGNTLTGPGTLDATTAGVTDPNNPYGGSSGNAITTPQLSGTPTTPGSYTMNLVAYEFGAQSGGATNGLVSSSFPFTVIVNAAGGGGGTPSVTAPAFTTSPSSQTISSGSTVAFNAAASGTPAPTFQWNLNGAAISGATSALLVINGATSANAGSYTCVATNSASSVTSSAATLTVSSTTDVGRLINLSTRAGVGTGANVLIVGYVIGGAGTSGTKPILVRGSGPTLTAIGVPGALPDPMLTLTSNSTVVASNSGWAGNAQISSESAAVGAFAFSSPTSKDSALFESALPSGAYTAEIAGASGDTGVSLAEVYDATASGTYTPTTPRLVNLSARVQVGTGANILIAGFVIGGSTSRTVLIRASGPAIAAFVPGALSDPQLLLYRANSDGTNTLLMTSPAAGWGGNSQIVSAAASVGAFPWGSPTSLDSAFLVTLPPGGYSAQVSGASGDTGISLVEVYEVQ